MFSLANKGHIGPVVSHGQLSTSYCYRPTGVLTLAMHDATMLPFDKIANISKQSITLCDGKTPPVMSLDFMNHFFEVDV